MCVGTTRTPLKFIIRARGRGPKRGVSPSDSDDGGSFTLRAPAGLVQPGAGPGAIPWRWDLEVGNPRACLLVGPSQPIQGLNRRLKALWRAHSKGRPGGGSSHGPARSCQCAFTWSRGSGRARPGSGANPRPANDRRPVAITMRRLCLCLCLPRTSLESESYDTVAGEDGRGAGLRHGPAAQSVCGTRPWLPRLPGARCSRLAGLGRGVREGPTPARARCAGVTRSWRPGKPERMHS